MNINEIEEKIKTILVNELSPKLIYIFGSIVANRVRNDSDIDIAILTEKKIDEYQEQFSNPSAAAVRGYVDMIIDPRETRPRLITTFEMLSTKRESLPGKKHGNIPL